MKRWHGTAGGYTNHHCRCARCRKAWAAAIYRRKETRARLMADGVLAPPHGTVNTYHAYKCRCEPCRAAWSARNRQRYQEKHPGARVYLRATIKEAKP